MVIEIVNPVANFMGLFESDDIDQRGILEQVGELVQTNYLNDIAIDVLEEFTYVSEYEITERPVQTGFPVTDSRRRLPDRITLIGVQATGQEPGKPVALEGTPLTDGKSWKDKHDEVMELKDRQELVTLTTSHRVYEGYFIQNVQMVRAAGDRSDAFFFTIELKESTFSEAQIEQVDPSMIPRAKRKKKTQNNNDGDKQGRDKSNRGNRDSEPDNRTFAKKLLQQLAGGS